jgi:hypothetical protein
MKFIIVQFCQSSSVFLFLMLKQYYLFSHSITVQIPHAAASLVLSQVLYLMLSARPQASMGKFGPFSSLGNPPERK